MSLRCGMVGLPNVGKSTLFNAMTKTSQAECGNYPFCTIEPNVASITIKDLRIDKIAEISNSKKKIFSTLTIVDIAGLVEGASKGSGMGNKFLANIRDVDLIIHVVRCFEDDDIIHVSDNLNPINDIQSIENELIIADLELVEKNIPTFQKKMLSKPKDYKLIVDTLIKIKSALYEGIFISDMKNLSKEGIDSVSFLNLITMKKLFYVANVDQDFSEKSKKNLDVIKSYAKSKSRDVLEISAILEHEFASCSEEEMSELLRSIGFESTGVSKIATTGYSLLNRLTFFTTGEQETRAWSISKNCNAKDAAGKIHSDISKGFIKAEILSYESFIQNSGWANAKKNGSVRFEGKDYIMQDGDICDFKFKAP